MSDNLQLDVSGDGKPVIRTVSPNDVESSPSPLTPAQRASPKGIGYGVFQQMGLHGLSPQAPPFSHVAPPLMNMSNFHLMQYYQPIPPNASQPPQTDAPITGQSSGSIKQTHKEGIVSFPSKKAKKSKTGDGEEPKMRGCPNKVWLSVHDDVLIPFLVEQVKKGLKCDKKIKRAAFESAADHVNSVFKTDYTTDNVVNRMRSLKTRYFEMSSVFQKINGAKWDEEKQMITADKVVYDNIKEENAKLKELINTPLKHFKNLRIIFCTDDYATGEFRKSVYDSFGGGGDGIRDKSEDPVEVASDDNQMPANATKCIQPPPVRKENLKKDKQPPARIRRPKFHENDNVIVASLKEMADAIRHAHIEHWSKELSALVYKHVKYPMLVLDEAFDFFYDEEKRARRFIAKPFAAQDRMIKEFIAMSGIQIEEGTDVESQADGLGEDVVDI